MDFGLTGRVVIVTGATANIGRAIALDFAAEGAKVVVVGRDAEAGARVVALATERGAQAALFVKADVLDPDGPAHIVDKAESLGPVQVLVNNVGSFEGVGVFTELTPANWRATIDLTLTSNLNMTHAILPSMIARRSGRIINIGSTAGIVGESYYSAAKAAVHGFTRALAKEVAEHSITVNCVAPGGTMDEDPAAFSSGSRFNPEQIKAKAASLPKGALEELHKKRRKVPLPRQVAKPDEIAAAVLWLASSRADFVTGQIVAVDGGVLL
jgi:2-hydroxycyclohexanecarboxyl-CoA dehydrogenase